jgi:hypothetical protein
MCVRTLCGNTTARRSGNESFLQEVGLVDIADGVGFLSDRRSQGLDSDRAAVELVDYRCQVAVRAVDTLAAVDKRWLTEKREL